jgi:hypothetical protein
LWSDTALNSTRLKLSLDEYDIPISSKDEKFRMKKETKSQLESLLDNYQKKQLEAEMKQEQSQYTRELFLDNFKELREKVIRPSMTEIGEILEQKGHKYNIKEQEYSIDRKGFTQEAHIEFNILPEGKEEKSYYDNHPSITFIADTGSLKVQVRGSYVMPDIRGESSRIGTYELSEISSDIVEKEILDILIKAFNR